MQIRTECMPPPDGRGGGSRVAGDFVGWEVEGKFEEAVGKLVQALRADAMGRDSGPKSRL